MSALGNIAPQFSQVLERKVDGTNPPEYWLNASDIHSGVVAHFNLYDGYKKDDYIRLVWVSVLSTYESGTHSVNDSDVAKGFITIQTADAPPDGAYKVSAHVMPVGAETAILSKEIGIRIKRTRPGDGKLEKLQLPSTIRNLVLNSASELIVTIPKYTHMTVYDSVYVMLAADTADGSPIVTPIHYVTQPEVTLGKLDIKLMADLLQQANAKFQANRFLLQYAIQDEAQNPRVFSDPIEVHFSGSAQSQLPAPVLVAPALLIGFANTGSAECDWTIDLDNVQVTELEIKVKTHSEIKPNGTVTVLWEADDEPNKLVVQGRTLVQYMQGQDLVFYIPISQLEPKTFSSNLHFMYLVNERVVSEPLKLCVTTQYLPAPRIQETEDSAHINLALYQTSSQFSIHIPYSPRMTGYTESSLVLLSEEEDNPSNSKAAAQITLTQTMVNDPKGIQFKVSYNQLVLTGKGVRLHYQVMYNGTPHLSRYHSYTFDADQNPSSDAASFSLNGHIYYWENKQMTWSAAVEYLQNKGRRLLNWQEMQDFARQATNAQLHKQWSSFPETGPKVWSTTPNDNSQPYIFNFARREAPTLNPANAAEQHDVISMNNK